MTGLIAVFYRTVGIKAINETSNADVFINFFPNFLLS